MLTNCFSHTDDLSSSGVVSHSAMSNSLLSMDRGAWPWNSPGKNTGVGCHFLLPGIFPTRGPDPLLTCLLHCKWILTSVTAGKPRPFSEALRKSSERGAGNPTSAHISRWALAAQRAAVSVDSGHAGHPTPLSQQPHGRVILAFEATG